MDLLLVPPTREAFTYFFHSFSENPCGALLKLNTRSPVLIIPSQLWLPQSPPPTPPIRPRREPNMMNAETPPRRCCLRTPLLPGTRRTPRSPETPTSSQQRKLPLAPSCVYSKKIWFTPVTHARLIDKGMFPALSGPLPRYFLFLHCSPIQPAPPLILTQFTDSCMAGRPLT